MANRNVYDSRRISDFIFFVLLQARWLGNGLALAMVVSSFLDANVRSLPRAFQEHAEARYLRPTTSQPTNSSALRSATILRSSGGQRTLERSDLLVSDGRRQRTLLKTSRRDSERRANGDIPGKKYFDQLHLIRLQSRPMLPSAAPMDMRGNELNRPRGKPCQELLC